MSDNANRMAVEDVMSVFGIPFARLLSDFYATQPLEGGEYRIKIKDISSAFPDFDEAGAFRAFISELKSEGWRGFWGDKSGEFVTLVVRG